MSKEKEFLTPAEAARLIGISRASLYNYMRALDITPVRMGPDKRRVYLALADVQKMRDWKAEPWTVEATRQDAPPTTLRHFRAPLPEQQ